MTLVVVPDDVARLTDALKCVTVGGEINIREGEYHESLVLSEDVHLTGEGTTGAVVITSETDPVLTVQKCHVEIENVTFRYDGADSAFHAPSPAKSDQQAVSESNTKSTADELAATDPTATDTQAPDTEADPSASSNSTASPKAAIWLQEGQLNLRNCNITSTYAGGVVANTSQSQLTMEKCRVYSIGQMGVLVMGEVQFSMNECLFEDNRFAIICQDIPQFEVRNTSVLRTGRTGIVLKNASGRFEKCSVQEASSTGLDIFGGGHSTFVECQFRQNVCDVLRSVAIHDTDATFENCLFTGVFTNVGLFTEGAGNRVFQNCRFEQTSTAIRTSGKDLFEQCVLDGNDQGRIGIWLEKGGAPTFRQCKIMGFQTDAAQITTGSTSNFEGCEFISTKGGRCLSVAADSSAVSNQCRFQGGGAEVVRIASTTGTIFENCDISGGEIAGVCIDAEGNPTFRKNCKIHQNQRVGISAEARSAGVFEDCEIYDNGGSAVLLMARSQTTLRRCELRGGSLCALQVEQDGTGTLETCKLIGKAGGHGIFVRRGGEPTIRDTKISQRTGAAIYLQEQSAGLYENCTIDQCAVGVHSDRSSPELRGVSILNTGIGMQIMAKSAGLVDHCEIQNTTNVGVEAKNSQTIFQNTKIHGCGSTGVTLFDTCNMCFATCEIFENGGDGIALRDHSVVNLEKCIIRNNQGFGTAYSPESTVKSDAATQMPDNRDGESQQKTSALVSATAPTNGTTPANSPANPSVNPSVGPSANPPAIPRTNSPTNPPKEPSPNPPSAEPVVDSVPELPTNNSSPR